MQTPNNATCETADGVDLGAPGGNELGILVEALDGLLVEMELLLVGDDRDRAVCVSFFLFDVVGENDLE